MKSLIFLLPVAAATLCAQSPARSPEARTREVLDLFFAKRYDAIYSMFTDEMKKAVTLDAYKSTGAQIAALGPVESIGAPQVQSRSGFTVVTIRLKWQPVTLNFGVTWNPLGQIAGNWFRPEAPAPAPLQPGEQEVRVGGDEWKLPGTLTLPTGKGPFPAVVLVHGSGPHDRDETIGPNKVFRDLAEGLAAKGVAVLRYEKRTKAYPEKCAADAGFTMTAETVDDAIQAVALLRGREAIDPARIYVLGHSQGGYMMPRILKRDAKIAGGIVLAGNVRPLEELAAEQADYILSLSPQGPPEQRRKLEEMKRSPATALGIPARYLEDLKGYNPAAEARDLKMPMLILQGERDYQVTMRDFALWKESLGSRRDVTFRSYPNLNHLFLAGEGKSKPSEYAQPGHVATAVTDDIAAWIRRQ